MATAVEIREHYDSLAFIYRAFWGDHIHHGFFDNGDEAPEVAQVALLEYCTELLGLNGSEHVLDVGCGHGGTLLQLAQLFDCSGVGITVSPKQAYIADDNARKAGLQHRISVQVDNADHFEFPASTFDLVWAMESTEHFADKDRFFSNAAAALVTEGQLLVAAWTGSMENVRVREVARAFLCPEMWTAQRYSQSIKRAGLEVTHCEDLTSKIARTWEICEYRARIARLAIPLLPKAAREFVEGIPIILDAYRSGDLTYTVLTARKPGT